MARRYCPFTASITFVILLAHLLFAQDSRPAAAKPDVPTKRPFLWMIEGKSPSFVYGTIHLGDDRIMQIPEVVEEALELADAVYTEIPMDLAAIMVMVGPKMQLPQGQTLKTVLPAELYARAERYLKPRGISMGMFNSMKVWVFTTQLALLDDVKNLGSLQGLDMYVYQEAERDGKEVGGLETIDEQLGVFEAFTEKEQIQMLESTLELLEEAEKKGEKMTPRLKDAYLAGREDELMKLMFEYMDMNDPLEKRSFDLLITQRDKRMAERIAEKIKANPEKSYLFAIGAGHVAGKDASVLTHLKDKGFKLRRLSPEDVASIKTLKKQRTAEQRKASAERKPVEKP